MSVAERNIQIQTPRAFLPLLEPSRYKALYGGRGGAKSHQFADLLIEACIMVPGMRAVCVREVQKSLEQSVKRLLEDKIEAYGLGREFKVMNTHIETPGNGIIIFVGMQNHTAESIKSLEGFRIAWVEEAQTLSQHSLDLLRPTMRLEDSELWFSWNPRNESDPVDALFRGGEPPPGTIAIPCSYKDNPFFPEVLMRELEWDRRRDPDKYAHVWLGGYEKNSEKRVFKNWKIEEFETPSDVHFLLGGDWGYSVDPAVCVRLFIVGRKLFIDHEAYKIGVEIDHLPAHFDQVPNARAWPMIADSQRPDTISYMQRHGYPKIEASIKGANSVKEGVIFLQGYDIVVHPRCKHTADELTAYSYVVDKQTGNVLPVLEDKKNHVIDSLRYAVEKVRRAKAGGALAGKAVW